MASVVFFGTPDFGVPVLRALLEHHRVLAVITQPDRYAGRGRRTLMQPPVKELSIARQVPVLQPPRLRRDKAALATLRELNADVFVLAAYGQILRPNVLEIPPHGVIGVHASLLPLYRGAAPVAAAIRGGDQETGITLMLTDAGMDTGAMIAQRNLAISPDDTTETLSERLAHLGAALITEVLPAWLAGEIRALPQEDALATFAPLLTKEEGHVDWERSATEIDRLVRAFTPWPGTFCMVGDKSLKIVRVRPEPEAKVTVAPGTVLDHNGGVAVSTGAGLLILEIVQPAGKSPLQAVQYARGRRDLIGGKLE